MYCKNCGKKIADDSRFCTYCGTQVDSEISGAGNTVVANHLEGKQKVELSTADEAPIEVSILPPTLIKKSTVANEIVENLKMVGWAALIWLAYMIVLAVVQTIEEDARFGTGEDINGMATRIYEEKLQYEKNGGEDFAQYERLESISNTPYLENKVKYKCKRDAQIHLRKAQAKAQAFVLTDELERKLRDEALWEAKKEIKRIIDARRGAVKETLIDHALWAALIAVALMIVWRYFVKACRWVSANRLQENVE